MNIHKNEILLYFICITLHGILMFLSSFKQIRYETISEVKVIPTCFVDINEDVEVLKTGNGSASD